VKDNSSSKMTLVLGKNCLKAAVFACKSDL